MTSGAAIRSSHASMLAVRRAPASMDQSVNLRGNRCRDLITMNASTPRSRSPLVFFSLVFALCIPAWLVGAATRFQLLPGLPVSSLVVVTPVAAALILVYRESGIAGVTKLPQRSFDYRRIRPQVWYAPIMLFWPGVMVPEYGLLRLAGSPVPAPQLPVLAPLIMFLTFFIGGLGEELEWSGYIVDAMQYRWNAIQASVLLGSVSGHVAHPTVGASSAVSRIYRLVMSRLRAGTGPFRLALCNNTGKSVFAVALFHTMLNISWQLLPINGSYYDPRITALIVALAAVFVVFTWGPQTLD